MFYRAWGNLDWHGNTSCAKNSIYRDYIEWEHRVYGFSDMTISIIYKE